jgi:hypothetical protein
MFRYNPRGVSRFFFSLSLSRKEGGEMLLCDFGWLVGVVGWLADGGSGWWQW